MIPFALFTRKYPSALNVRRLLRWKFAGGIAREYPEIPDYVESLRTYAEREVHPDDRKGFMEFVQPENLRRMLTDRPVVALSFRVTVEGAEKVYGLRVVRGADEDSVAFAFADVTDEAMREKRHQRQVAMTEARTKFFFNVSHDVRTPVHAIMGLIDMCRDEVERGKLNAEGRGDAELFSRMDDYLAKMKASGGLLLSIIKSVLDMSRIEAGKVKLDETFGDVRLSFYEIEPTLRELAAEKDIRISFGFGEIRDRYIIADYDKCSRVFVNIISNAIKYTPDGGRVDVKCEQVLDSAPGADRVAWYRYTFTDNGIGMSEEFQKRLYDQFSRENNTTMSGVAGLGLGMAIVKSFVTVLGGRIECRSKKDEGTVFTVTLPYRVQEGRKWIDPRTGALRDADGSGRARIPAAPQAGSAGIDLGNASGGSGESALPFAGRRALLVDDTKMSRMVALHYLKKYGLIVETAENGQEAVEKVKAGTYDIVLMDMQMPVMDGIEAAKAMRAAGISVPIVAWTANAYDEDVQRALDAGMNGHIAKGTKSAVLAETLARYIGSSERT